MYDDDCHLWLMTYKEKYMFSRKYMVIYLFTYSVINSGKFQQSQYAENNSKGFWKRSDNWISDLNNVW